MTSEPTELDVSSDEKPKAKDYKGLISPDWCAGCGDFGVLTCLMKAWAELNILPSHLRRVY